MSFRRSAIAGFYLAILAGSANAQESYQSSLVFHTADSLVRACDQKSPRCYSYIMGFSDALAITQIFDKNTGATEYCLPMTATLDRMVGAITAYIRAHPEERDRPASGMVAIALMKTFPCKTER